MTSYLVSFSVYTLAMIGVIFVGLIIVKKSLYPNSLSSTRSQFLSVESCLNLEPRKNLYIVKAGEERFLLSTDTEGSHFLTKLEADNTPSIQEIDTEKVQPSFNVLTSMLNLTKNIVKSVPGSQGSLKTKFSEKLDNYVTFQRP
jgi:flagellar biogenesis protein FliO